MSSIVTPPARILMRLINEAPPAARDMTWADGFQRVRLIRKEAGSSHCSEVIANLHSRTPVFEKVEAPDG